MRGEHHAERDEYVPVMLRLSCQIHSDSNSENCQDLQKLLQLSAVA